jgi:hypothetical protein
MEHKTKRPRLDLSHGTPVDQPSPKCCSRKRLDQVDQLVYGTRVLQAITEVTLSILAFLRTLHIDQAGAVDLV